MDMKENMAHLNPNAHEFVPLEVKAGACQKSVDYLCKMTGLETLLSLVQRHDHKGFAGASLNAPIHHHHHPHPVRSSLEKVSATPIASESTIQQTAAFQASLFVEEEVEDESEMFENRVRAKISGVRSQVSGVQRYSHALLYITDCGTPMRTAKLTSYEHFNEGLVQIFGDHIPAALSHVHHEFYYHLIQDKLFYRVQLSFSFDDGKNVVKFDSRYGFTDALLNVYEKFSYMLESWGYTLLDGNVHPVRPESWFDTKAPILELVGKERLVYSKQDLLSIAAIQSMKGDDADVVNAATISSFPESLRTDHVSFVSRNVVTEEDIQHKKQETEKIGHTWHRRHHRRHNNHNHNVAVKQEDVVVVKKLAPGERKKSEPTPIRASEEVIEVKRAASMQVQSSSRRHNFVDIDRDDLSEQICIVEKDSKDVVKVVTKKNRRRNRRIKNNNNNNNKHHDKNSEEDTSGSSSDEHASKEAQKEKTNPTHEADENAQKGQKEDQKVDDKGEIAEVKVKSKRRRRRRGKKAAAAKSSEEETSSSASSGEHEKHEHEKHEAETTDSKVEAEKEKEEPETVQKAKRHRSRRGKRGGKRNSLSNDDANASTPTTTTRSEEKIEEKAEDKVIEVVF